MINGSVTVRRRAGVSIRGLRRVKGIKKECNKDRGLRFKDKGFYTSLYSRLLYF